MYSELIFIKRVFHRTIGVLGFWGDSQAIDFVKLERVAFTPELLKSFA